MHTAIKIGHDGAELARDAGGHAAVLVPAAGLMWASATLPKSMPHAAAEAACKALTLAGFNDWRLPTVEELFALADRTRYRPAIDTDLYPGTKSDWYWSASAAASAPADFAWLVDFGYGNSYCYLRYDDAFVRAVCSVGASQ